MGTLFSKKRRPPADSPTKIIVHSQTTGPFPNSSKMYSPFRGLRRAHSTSAGSLLVLPQTSSSNFSYPYPRTHTTLVVPSSAVQQRDRPPLFDDSPTSATPSSTFGQAPFRRPPLNRAIPPIPESRSNESIISQASQLTHRHSISGTSASVSIPPKELPARAAVLPKDTSVVIENKMAQNLGARYATNIPVTTIQTTSVNIQPSTSIQPPTKTVTTKKTVAIITTRKIEEPTISAKKPTRLPLATNKKTRASRDTEPKSPLLNMARSVRTRLNKLGTRIGRATSRSPIRSKSMVSMRRDTSNLDRSGFNHLLSKSTSEQPVASFDAPPPPTTSPPHEDDLQSTGRVSINSQRSASQIPRRLPTTTLIPSPGIYFRRLPEDERLENEGPILTIDSKEALPTPDENKLLAPILLLRKASGEIKESPLENPPVPPNKKRANFRRHKHSHSFAGDSATQIKTPKLTARLIVRQPSEPLYYQKTHRRSKSRDAIIDMQTPRVVIKRKPAEGEESVKTTRSLKIVTYTSVPVEPVEEKKLLKPVKKSHKKSSSVDISEVCAASKKYSATGNTQGSTHKRGSTALCSSASASKADEMRLHKGSLIPRTVKWVNKNRRAPLAIAEQTRVANSPAVELPPNGFEDADLKMRQSRLLSPAKTRRMVFWRSRSKSTDERSNKQAQNDRNNNSRSVDQSEPVVEEYRIITTARITTRPPLISSTETDNNGNTVEKTPKTERETRLGRLTLNELIASPLNARKKVQQVNNRVQQAKQRSGFIDDEIEAQPNLVISTQRTTELAFDDLGCNVLIDEPSSFLSRDLNQNFDEMGDLTQQRTVRVRENEQAAHYVASSIQQQPQRINQSVTSPSPPKIPPHEHAAIEKIIEDLSSQLSRIKEFAIEDEDEMKKLRVENSSLKEELQIKDQVIQLLMSRLKAPTEVESVAQK